MSDQPREKIVLNRGQDDLVFLHALTNLPLGNAMKNTHYPRDNLAFLPDCCQLANRAYQNYKTTFARGSQTTKDKIEASLDYAPVLELFDNNFYLEYLGSQLEAYKMSRNKKNTSPRQQAGGALK
jgi:hypothetical protein